MSWRTSIYQSHLPRGLGIADQQFWPFEELTHGTKRDENTLALDEIQADLRERSPVVHPELTVIDNAGPPDLTASLQRAWEEFDQLVKEETPLRSEWHDSYLKRRDLKEFQVLGERLRALRQRRIEAKERLELLIEQAHRERQEPLDVAKRRQARASFEARIPGILASEVVLSEADETELLLAKRAWDDGAKFVSVRITGEAPNLEIPRSKVWSHALSQILDFGWQLHTWSVDDGAITPLLQRPND